MGVGWNEKGTAGMGRRVVSQRYKRKLLGVMGMVIFLITVIVSQVYMYVKTSNSVHFSHVQFIECQLHLNKVGGKAHLFKF